MSEKDGHIVGPLEDQKAKLERNDPGIVYAENPIPPKLPFFPQGYLEPFGRSNLPDVRQEIEAVMQRIKINGIAPTFNGGNIEFEIVPKTQPTPPVISEVVHPIPPVPVPNPTALAAEQAALTGPVFTASSPRVALPEGPSPQAGPKVAEVNPVEGLPPVRNTGEVSKPPTVEIESKPPSATKAPSRIFKYSEQSKKPEPAPHAFGEAMNTIHGSDRVLPTRADHPETHSPARKTRTPRVSQLIHRQKGETRKAFKIRKDTLRKEIREGKKNIPVALAHGDTTFFSSGYVPVLLTRADGLRKILTYVIEDNSQVIEGAQAGEKTGSLPAKDSYYEAGGDGSLHPFKLVTAVDGWKVSPVGSTITDGTNGTNLSITGLDTVRSDTGLVAVKVSISANLTASSASIQTGFTKEVVASGTPPAQTEAWLLIGKVTSTGTPATYSFKQAITSAALLTHGFLNGSIVRVFDSAPTHPSNL